MKKILGLDLGANSIGWAFVKEGEKREQNAIIDSGVRVNPLSSDEQNDFATGKSVSINADRTLKRHMRRNIDRYQLRREDLKKVLLKEKVIHSYEDLYPSEGDLTYGIWEVRARAAKERVDLKDFARVLLAINKKRGYKSNRKAKDSDDGEAVDGMELALKLHEENLTPGQYTLNRLKEDLPKAGEFYISDLENELELLWEKQANFYPEILVDDLKQSLIGKGKKQVWAICKDPFSLEGIKQTGSAKEKLREVYSWRVDGLKKQLDLEHFAIVLQSLLGEMSGTSGYLGKISDRSKELYFKKQTVGEYLYNQILEDNHTRLKNQVFYRQDYIEEFETIWSEQSKHHQILTDELKKEIMDTIVFYQRPLKSQKGQIAICDFESIEVQKEDKTLLVGPRVIPRSSPIFQQFKVWSMLNNLAFKHKESNKVLKIEELDDDCSARRDLEKDLEFKGKLSNTEILKYFFKKDCKKWDMNYAKGIEGNLTMQALYEASLRFLEMKGVTINNKLKVHDKVEAVHRELNKVGVDSSFLTFNPTLEQEKYLTQPAYDLWHLLYSYQGDNSKSGDDKLLEKLQTAYGFCREGAKEFTRITFSPDYGNLSSKAIRKIIPHMLGGEQFSEACSSAGYNHSNSLTKDENEQRELLDELEILKKNSLRNPVVEKILNQMVNLVNQAILTHGRPDEIRIELARELKKSASERAEMTSAIDVATTEHIKLRKELAAEVKPFCDGVRITRNDIIKYKLYKELESNGFKDVYENKYIAKSKLFSREIDIEHIIPKALCFDDSFSNKTLAFRDFNNAKDNRTAYDYLSMTLGEESEEFKNYVSRVKKLKSDDKISYTKERKLLMPAAEIPEGFIERDLRNSQYIAKKAQEMLRTVVRTVTATTGRVTDILREDWQLINVMQELNWDVHHKLGLTHVEMNKNGQKIPKITNWTKRVDQRHHAIDAITIAFSKPSLIQYINHKSARKDEAHKFHKVVSLIERKETYFDENKRRRFKPPIELDKLRDEVKGQMEKLLVSYKAKNKVVTRNQNITKTKTGTKSTLTHTPRGQLHKETVYGQSHEYVAKMETVNSKFDYDKINTVASKAEREALCKRLKEYSGDSKKAFTGLKKNPIFLNESNTEKLAPKVKTVELAERFTIRKAIDKDLNVDKVVDKGVRNILKQRIKDHGNSKKEAFANLDSNPIWLNKEKGIALKRVTITGVTTARPLHVASNHRNKVILDDDGKQKPTDFVSQGNNHHIAIYSDPEGNLHEQAVSFYDAVERFNAGLPIIDKEFNNLEGWEFMFTMKQNEMFVFADTSTGFDPTEVDLLDIKNYHLISPNLFRVQKISPKDYWFRLHRETAVQRRTVTEEGKAVDVDDAPLRDVIFKRLRSGNALLNANLVKVRMNHIGHIVSVGEE